MLIGVPTPSNTVVLSSGKISHTTSVIAYISSAGSLQINRLWHFLGWLAYILL
jgi:hypothetical protein